MEYKMNPLISVIIPIYNVEAYLKRCVRSVQNQSYANIEIILVDDGSHDNCPVMCDALAEEDSRIRVIHQKNAGLSAARNAGIKIALGNYVWFVDSDDYIIPDALEILVSEIGSNEYDILVFEADVFCETPDMQGVLSDNKYHRNKKYPSTDGKECLVQYYQNGDYRWSVCLSVWNLRFLKNNYLLFKEGLIFEDIPFTLKALLHAKKVKTISEKLYIRTVRNGSITNSKISAQKMSSCFDIFVDLTSLLEDQYNEEVKNVITEIADEMLCAGIKSGISLLANKSIEIDNLLMEIKKCNIPFPTYEEQKNLIFYGGGNVCRLLLSYLPNHPSVIWDKNADEIGIVCGVNCVVPTIGEQLDAIIIICVANIELQSQIKSQFIEHGYRNVYSYYEFAFSKPRKGRF